MTRSNLAAAIHSMSVTAEVFKNSGVLDPSEYKAIHSALWQVVIEREKADIEKRAEGLAEGTSECL